MFLAALLPLWKSSSGAFSCVKSGSSWHAKELTGKIRQVKAGPLLTTQVKRFIKNRILANFLDQQPKRM
jgi:hypothetical protein